MPPFETQKRTYQPGSGGHGGDFPELDAETRKAIFDRFSFAGDYFNGHLGMRLVEVRRGYSKLEVENTKRLCQPAGVMHGGASFGLADTAVAFALMSVYGYNTLMLTIEMQMHYLEPIPLGLVTAEAYILREGGKSAYAEVDVWAQSKLAARATTTYMLRPISRAGDKG